MMRTLIKRFLRGDAGVSTLEYAMLVGLMAVAVGAAILTLSQDVQTAITNIGDQIADVDVTGQGDIAGDNTAP